MSEFGMGQLGQKKDSNAVGGPPKRSLLDGIITGLFGPPTDEMTPEEGNKVQNAREAEAKAVVNAATSAWQSPGKSYMGPPPAIASTATPLSVLGDIVKFFKKGSNDATTSKSPKGPMD